MEFWDCCTTFEDGPLDVRQTGINPQGFIMGDFAGRHKKPKQYKDMAAGVETGQSRVALHKRRSLLT